MTDYTTNLSLNKPEIDVETNWGIRWNENADILDDAMLLANVSGTGTVTITDLGSGNVLISGSAVAEHVHDTSDITIGFLVPARGGTGTGTMTGSRAIQTTASGSLGVSATTSTELGYVSGVTSAIQPQLDTKATVTEVGTASGTLQTQINAIDLTPYILEDGSRYFTGENGVGIGDSADASYALDVRGSNVKISNEADVTAVFRLDCGSTAGQIGVIAFADQGKDEWQWTKTADNELYLYDYDQAHHVIKVLSYSGNAETIVVASGSLGVGAQAESGYKLDVQGNSKIRGDLVATSGTYSNSVTVSGSPVRIAAHSNVDSVNAQTGVLTISGTSGVQSVTTSKTITLSAVASEIDHGSLSGNSDDDHDIYVLAAGGRDIIGNQVIGGNLTVSGSLIGVTEQLDMHVPEPTADDTIAIRGYAFYSFDIESIWTELEVATCNIAVNINDVAVTGLSSVAVSTTGGISSATANNSVTTGDKVDIVINSADSTASGLTIAINITRTS